MVNELAIIIFALDDDDLVIHTINGLGDEYKEVATSICTREKSVSFEELQDFLTGFESYLHIGMKSLMNHILSLLKIINNSLDNQKSAFHSSLKRVVCQFFQKNWTHNKCVLQNTLISSKN
jgi:hypothetical protein